SASWRIAWRHWLGGGQEDGNTTRGRRLRAIPGRSAGGHALCQAVHEDVEQQLETLIRVDRAEVAGQGGEVGELPGRQRGEVAARIIFGRFPGRGPRLV